MTKDCSDRRKPLMQYVPQGPGFPEERATRGIPAASLDGRSISFGTLEPGLLRLSWPDQGMPLCVKVHGDTEMR